MNKIIIFIAALLLSACSLIFETDISDSSVSLIAPVDSLNTTTNTITFWWGYVKDAEKYNLQIVSPRWDSIISLVLDTNLTENKFTVSLPSGEYDWGVSAYNNSSSTEYKIFHITIDTSSNLTSQIVVLKSPEEDLSTNNTDISFSWYPVNSATSYLFDIKHESWQGSNLIPTQLLTVDTFNLVLDEGVYYWGVQARNDFSSTSYFTRKIIVDTTAPGIPSITNPVHSGDTLDNKNLKITWTRPIESLAEITDSLLISTDSIFSTANIVGKYFTRETEMSVDGLADGKYFCKVRSIDDAKNLGKPGTIKKFYIVNQ